MADEGGGDNPQIPKSYIYIFIILILFVARDFMNTPMSSTTKGDGSGGGSEREEDKMLVDMGGPGSRLSGKMPMGPSMKFMYWYGLKLLYEFKN